MNDKEEHEWHDGFPQLPRGLTVLPWLVWAFLIGLAIAAVFYSAKVKADPIAVANAGQVAITVYTDDCNFKDTVTNLPKRATWREGDKVYEGCVGVIPQLGVAMFYFSDKTVAVIPLDMFAKATGA